MGGREEFEGEEVSNVKGESSLVQPEVAEDRFRPPAAIDWAGCWSLILGFNSLGLSVWWDSRFVEVLAPTSIASARNMKPNVRS